MKSSIHILSALYQVLNIPSITGEINGKVYIGDVPSGDQKENISTNLLNNTNEYLQSGFGNVNIYVPEVVSGRANIARFNQLVNIIIPIIKDTQHNDVFFQIDDDKGFFKDPDRDNTYFYNIKITFQTI